MTSDYKMPFAQTTAGETRASDSTVASDYERVVANMEEVVRLLAKLYGEKEPRHPITRTEAREMPAPFPPEPDFPAPQSEADCGPEMLAEYLRAAPQASPDRDALEDRAWEWWKADERVLADIETNGDLCEILAEFATYVLRSRAEAGS